MDPQYLNTLKSLTTSKQKKVKIESKEQILMENEPKGVGDLHAEIIKFVIANPKPSHAEVLAYSKKLGIELIEFDRHVYMLLSSILTEGNSKGKDIKHDPDPEQLTMGIKVEMEHTSEPLISQKIALDHLAEIPDYYTRLAKMEKEAGVDHHD